MSAARNRASKVLTKSEDSGDSDVPAAVLCAQCGKAECAGCFEERLRSGVVAIVPWERPGGSNLGTLWATARAATLDAEGFFESLPDGPLGPAFRFAVLSETVASATMGVSALVPAFLVAPAWMKHVLFEQPLPAVRLAAAVIPALAMLLVAAHVVHGWALDRGARRSGAFAAARRALRFGLYAAGWDLVIGPLGALVVALKEGPAAALSIPRVGVGLPGRSARAFLRGCYRLEGASAGPALRASYVAASIATLVGALAVIAALGIALLL